MKLFYWIGYVYGRIKFAVSCGSYAGEKSMYREGTNATNAIMSFRSK